MNVLCILCCEVLVFGCYCNSGKAQFQIGHVLAFYLGYHSYLIYIGSSLISSDIILRCHACPIDSSGGCICSQSAMLAHFSLWSQQSVTHTLIAYSNQDFMLCLDWLVELHFLH
jgi:hypothetical protein